jgi:flagellar biosynthesis protein FliR
MTDILITDFILILLIFLRITAAFVSAPIFGNKAFPILPKLFMSFIIAYIVFLTIDTSTIQIETGLWWLFMHAMKEILSGLIIGYTLNFVFWGISYSGTLIGFDMGLSMAEVFNPTQESQSNVIGEGISIGAMLIFFLINGHHYLIQALVSSFSIVPIGQYSFTAPLFEMIIKYSASVFIIAVKIAAPIMVSFFLLHIAEGIIARVIPQMQVFFVAQPLKIGMGFVLLAAIMPIYIFIIKNLLQECEAGLYNIVKAMGS